MGARIRRVENQLRESNNTSEESSTMEGISLSRNEQSGDSSTSASVGFTQDGFDALLRRQISHSLRHRHRIIPPSPATFMLGLSFEITLGINGSISARSGFQAGQSQLEIGIQSQISGSLGLIVDGLGVLEVASVLTLAAQCGGSGTATYSDNEVQYSADLEASVKASGHVTLGLSRAIKDAVTSLGMDSSGLSLRYTFMPGKELLKFIDLRVENGAIEGQGWEVVAGDDLEEVIGAINEVIEPIRRLWEEDLSQYIDEAGNVIEDAMTFRTFWQENGLVGGLREFNDAFRDWRNNS
jgi:hypothetical protein